MKTTADHFAFLTQQAEILDKYQSDHLGAFGDEVHDELCAAYQNLISAIHAFKKQTDSPVEDSYPSYEDQHRLTASDLGIGRFA